MAWIPIRSRRFTTTGANRFTVAGSWFPDAFEYRMANLMAYLDGTEETLSASAADAYRTMAVVEAAYESSATGGTSVHYGTESAED